jgi:alpha-mannosidase
VGVSENVEDARELGELPWPAWIERARKGETSPELFVPVGGSEASRADARALLVDLGRVDLAPRVRSATAEEFAEQAAKRLGESVPPFTPGDLAPLQAGASVDELILLRRRCAAALSALETFGAIAHCDGSPVVDPLVASSWSSIDVGGTHDRARAALGNQLDVLARGATTLGEGTPIVAFNALPWPRRTLITLSTPGARVVASNGRRLASQQAGDGGSMFALDVPALGYEVVHALRADEPQTVSPFTSGVAVDGWTARNEELAFTIDPASGAITSLVALPDGTELLSGPARIGGDGWSVESAAFVERGPLRAVARIQESTPALHATIEFVLAARARELEVRCTLSRAGASTLPAFELPLRHASARALAGVPFGSSPVSASADPSEARHALLDWIAATDGTRGLGVLAQECATVLVSPGRLDVELLAPTGASRTTAFGLAPFSDGWKKAGLPELARELAAPVELFATDAHDGAREARHSFVSIACLEHDGSLVHGPESGVMLTALQPAADGGWVMRVVETSGRDQEVVLELDRPVFAAQRVDLRGSPLGALRCEGDRVHVAIGANRIENVHVRLRP